MPRHGLPLLLAVLALGSGSVAQAQAPGQSPQQGATLLAALSGVRSEPAEPGSALVRAAALLGAQLRHAPPTETDPWAAHPRADSQAVTAANQPRQQALPLTAPPAAAPLRMAVASPISVPELRQAALPPPPNGRPEVRFDLAVSNAPAAQVFLQIAQGTHYNMLVSPDVSGQISLTLKDTSVPEALDTMRELFGYEFRISGNRIFIYSNAVQTRLYRINYLPGRRQGSSDVRVSSSAITQALGAGASGSSGGNSGSGSNQPTENAQVRTTSDADFWREVQSSLTAMVGQDQGRSVVMNPAAGVVVVKATPSELRQVERYLHAVQISIERQVMLEAKIVEVRLGKDTQTGINWSVFGKVLGDRIDATLGAMAPGSSLVGSSLTGPDGTTITPGTGAAASAIGQGFYGLAFKGANFAALLNFLQTQGDVSVLSSPRIATLNNQKAVLKVGSDEMFVTGVSSSTTSSASASTTSPSVTLTPFFSGISLDVTPQIDEDGNVMLHIHPTVSTVTEKSKTIDLGAMGSYKLPLAASAVNETDSIVRVRDGQIVAIGGLMKTDVSNENTGVPMLQDAPLVGGLFRQSSKVNSKRELVIMLRPTVIKTDSDWPAAGGRAAAALAAEGQVALPTPAARSN